MYIHIHTHIVCVYIVHIYTHIYIYIYVLVLWAREETNPPLTHDRETIQLCRWSAIASWQRHSEGLLGPPYLGPPSL